jgi:hypothetical protein
MRGTVQLVLVLSAMSVWADPWDFTLSQLGNPVACNVQLVGDACAKPAIGFDAGANANFRAFSRRVAAAVTSVNLAPPKTLGHSAFAVSVETSIVSFEGSNSPTQLPTGQTVDRALIVPSIHVRKGLPWSFELGVRAAWWERSRMGAGTLELKWGLTEGFAYFPDIAVRGHVTKLLNTRDFDLTAGGVDLGLGKQFAIEGMLTITPYLGWNLVFVGASSGSVDFNPQRSLQTADTEVYDDYATFAPVQAANNANNRIYGGFRLVAGIFMLGAEVSYTVLGSFKDSAVGNVDMKGLLAGNFTLGLEF